MAELEIRLNSRCQADEIHILAVTEVNSKINSDDTQMCEYQLQGYDMFYVNQTPNEGRGVLLYVRRELEATPVTFDVQFQESVWLSIPISSNGKDSMLVGCIYRSPNSTEDNSCKLLQLLNEANTSKYAMY